MKFILLHIIIFIGVSAIAQKKDSSSGCSYTVKLKYPVLAIENNISGVVIVEMDRDENCMLANPRVIKGIGYGCDEEASAHGKALSPGVQMQYTPK